MARGLAYIDSSALLKLIFEEDESEAFAAAIVEWPELVSSVILDAEVHRAAAREGREAEVASVLDAVSLIDFNKSIRVAARSVGQSDIRGMDAIHLATAASLGADLGVLFTYDVRMLEAALLDRLPALAPKPPLF